MADKRREAIVPTRFDDDEIAADLTHLPSDAASALSALRHCTDRNRGLPYSHLKACQAKGRDDTRLAGCVKTYVPWPDGRYGLVLTAVEHPVRPWGLRVIAYGVRHSTGHRQLSVYQVAHKRLHG